MKFTLFAMLAVSLGLIPSTYSSNLKTPKSFTLKGKTTPNSEVRTKISFSTDDDKSIPLICRSPDFIGTIMHSSDGKLDWDDYTVFREHSTFSDADGNYSLRVPLRVARLICRFKVYPYIAIEVRTPKVQSEGEYAKTYSLHLTVLRDTIDVEDEVDLHSVESMSCGVDQYSMRNCDPDGLEKNDSRRLGIVMQEERHPIYDLDIIINED